MKKISISITIAALLMYGCSDKPEQQETKEQTKTQTTQAAPAQNLYGVSSQENAHSNAPAQSDTIAQAQHVGIVTESMNAAGYTYAKVNEDGNEYWIAGPQTTVSKGDKVSFIEQMVMENFTSKALNKTFDSLVFASALIPVDNKKNSSAKKDHDCNDCSSDKQHTNQTAQAAPANGSNQPPVHSNEKISVAKISGGYTVSELYSKKSALKDKKIKINAKVVKVSKNIMKKDWIHLQDGSGTGATSDIVVTATNANVNVGDTVTTEAVLNLDVDFGYGYFFPVILQEAKFTIIK